MFYRKKKKEKDSFAYLEKKEGKINSLNLHPKLVIKQLCHMNTSLLQFVISDKKKKKNFP